jgi:hypothetical protein
LPLRNELDVANKKLDVAMADLKKKEDELAAVQKILDQLNSEFE